MTAQAAIANWQTLLNNSLASRLDFEPFTDYIRILYSRNPLPSQYICEIFLRPDKYNDIHVDPRVLRYVQILLAEGFIDCAGILRVLLRYSSLWSYMQDGHMHSEANNGADKTKRVKGGNRRWKMSYSAEEMMLYRLAKTVSTGIRPKNVQEAVDLLMICIQWMDMVATSMGRGAHEILDIEAHVEEIGMVGMALGTLMVAVVGNAKILGAIQNGRCPKGTGIDLGKAMAGFVPLLLQSSPQNVQRLDVFRTQTLITILPVDKKERVANAEINEILDSTIGMNIDNIVVADLPTINSRAGLYIYFNSILVGRPLVDDSAIFAYLHNRYQGDVQSTTVDLILASFDVLANATFRNEGPQTTTILRSFLINKVPLLVSTLATSFFPPLTSEFCITEALSHVDTNAFPTLSTLFAESTNNDMFSDSVRQDFCFACCLHGLIPESSIETLLGDIPMQSLPAGGRYSKQDLVQQCLSDSERAEGLISELENMDGNAGAVSQAIAEVIKHMCGNKETMTLKTLCSQLARNPSSLDIMLLFNKPTSFLQPICELLDNWRYDEDQGEYQPVYEEFGSILLLVVSFAHRYNLSTVDLGIKNPTESFVAKLLVQGHLSRALDPLSQQDQNHLDGWIRGLFEPEGGGLGDELMSSCPPQEFYLLVPTLFHHIVLALSTETLSEEGLKGGLEFMVEPFLLPSLIPGITWLSAHLWEARPQATYVLQILSALIKSPPSISNNMEASHLLNAILKIIAQNLEQSLRWLQRAEPHRHDIDSISKALESNVGWERRGASKYSELEVWTATPGGGLTTSIKHTIVTLAQWGLQCDRNPGMQIMPASYTHRQVLAGLKILGAKRLLNTIIEEVKTQTEAGNGSVVLDIAISLICAPDSASFDSGSGIDIMSGNTPQLLQRRLTLREALKAEAENMPKVHKTDTFHAETVIRLYRRVEAQSVIQQQLLPDDNGMGGLDEVMGDAVMGDSGLGPVDQPNLDMHDMGPGSEDLMMMGGSGHGGDLLDAFGGDGLGDGMGF
ncbi:putative mediator of rna polymerase ii transcription subunit 5 protein [Botrytis fragariae]|uniref:Mediator of RNA polymerase II transcription subunit 5 n=1 Tax=Botrytis fragariae TaxID=1964551 RepID=A0A8H6EP23_9HELO|nr:putative mediator of rna polymerase ii transcription subunit 5 protein [Botrytis fragariae]KAF5879332.1 putative mediator of rna polymerase ii transcription subunit 5 protein [Botrytis fragariae]